MLVENLCDIFALFIIAGCRTNVNCPYDETCLHGRCERVCELSGACGQSAHCTPVSHQPHCSCPADLTGDPLVICQPGML